MVRGGLLGVAFERGSIISSVVRWSDATERLRVPRAARRSRGRSFLLASRAVADRDGGPIVGDLLLTCDGQPEQAGWL